MSSGCRRGRGEDDVLFRRMSHGCLSGAPASSSCPPGSSVTAPPSLSITPMMLFSTSAQTRPEFGQQAFQKYAHLGLAVIGDRRDPVCGTGIFHARCRFSSFQPASHHRQSSRSSGRCLRGRHSFHAWRRVRPERCVPPMVGPGAGLVVRGMATGSMVGLIMPNPRERTGSMSAPQWQPCRRAICAGRAKVSNYFDGARSWPFQRRKIPLPVR